MKKVISNLLILLLLPALHVFGQNETADAKPEKGASGKKSFAFFESDELLNATLRLDLTGYLRKNLKGGSLDGTLTLYPDGKDSLNWNVKIKNRGEFRLENCSFPPMALNFKKPVHAYPGSGVFKKLKLVTHCQAGKLADEYVLREYLVYKMFNVLTDTSFRVRLLKISYIDTQKKRKTISQYGFIIEPLEVLAGRTNSTVLKTIGLTQKQIVPDVMDRISIFNYMIANWDWNVPGQHNIAIIKALVIDYFQLGIAVPFDFDLCGVVNANYEVTPPEYGLSSNRDRIFLGICRTREVFLEDLKFFLRKKEEIYNQINEFPYLNQNSKKDITTFLDEFFIRLEKQKDIDKLIDFLLSYCKKI